MQASFTESEHQFLEPEPGDHIVSNLALPNIGCILRERDDGKLRLDLDAFKKYLQLLEMVVLHERLIVAAPNRDEFLEPEEFDSLIASHLLALFRRRGSLHLSFDVKEILQSQGILFEVRLDGGKSAKEYVEDVLASDHVRKGHSTQRSAAGKRTIR